MNYNIIVLLISTGYFICCAFGIKTKNFLSSLVFKIIPFSLAMACLGAVANILGMIRF